MNSINFESLSLTEEAKSQSEPHLQAQTQENTSTPLPALLKDQQEFNNSAAAFMLALKEERYNDLSEIVELIRRSVSDHVEAPLYLLLNTGIVPQIIQLLDITNLTYDYKQEKVLNDCAWIIANIASGSDDYVEYIVSHGIIPKALNLFDNPSDNIMDNGVWILANIAGSSLANRDSLLDHGIVDKIILCLDGKALMKDFLAHMSWLISNLCRGKPYPEFETVSPLLSPITFFITNVDHSEVLTNCLWALSYLSDGPDEQLKTIFSLGITEKIIASMSSPDPMIHMPASRLGGNLLSGNLYMTEILIDMGILSPLSNHLDSKNKILRKETCWALSNILAESARIIDAVFQFEDGAIIPKLLFIANQDTFSIATEAVYCLSNISENGTEIHIQSLVARGLIEILVETLRNNNNSGLLQSCLEAIQAILISGQGPINLESFYIEKIIQSGGNQVIEGLQNHPANEVAQSAKRITDEHTFIK